MKSIFWTLELYAQAKYQLRVAHISIVRIAQDFYAIAEFTEVALIFEIKDQSPYIEPNASLVANRGIFELLFKVPNWIATCFHFMRQQHAKSWPYIQPHHAKLQSRHDRNIQFVEFIIAQLFLHVLGIGLIGYGDLSPTLGEQRLRLHVEANARNGKPRKQPHMKAKFGPSFLKL